ncbi:MAG: glycosyltransferase family 4 protein [Caldilineaceae bacterium]|nr:glycosyltransferase family 4 protein [Caldilineaceae bacterium]
MRVLFLSGYQHPSAHRKVELLADTDGIDILHLTIPPSGLSDGAHPSASGARQYRSLEVPVYWPQGKIDPHRVVFRSALTRMRRFKPDIVHCEQEQEGLMAAQVALARSIFAPNAPLILYSWQNILRQRSLPVRIICRYTLSAASHMLCASSEAVEVLRRQGYTQGATIMPMFGIDTRYFHPKQADRMEVRCHLGLGNEDYLIGYCGRLIPEKGVDILLHALAELPQAKLLIVGSGSSEAQLHQLATMLGIESRCHFVPAQPYDSIASYLSALDVLVLPSRTTANWKEQYGRVLVEAMACEVAVVGSNSGAISEVLGTAGLLFPEGDVMALAATLHELGNRPHLRLNLASQGRLHALSRYSVECLSSEILQVWRGLLGSYPQTSLYQGTS